MSAVSLRANIFCHFLLCQLWKLVLPLKSCLKTLKNCQIVTTAHSNVTSIPPLAFVVIIRFVGPKSLHFSYFIHEYKLFFYLIIVNRPLRTYRLKRRKE